MHLKLNLTNTNKEGAKNSSGKKAGLVPVTGKCQGDRLLVPGVYTHGSETSEMSTGHLPETSIDSNQCPTRPALPVLTCDW